MRRRRCLLLLVLLCAYQLSWADDAAYLRELESRVVSPEALAPTCQLTWTVRPMLASATGANQESLDMWSQFWFGAAVKKEVLLAASSNIYSTAAKINGVHVVSFYWVDTERAKKFHAALAERYSDAQHAFQVHDTTVVAMTNFEVSAECFGLIQRRISEAYARTLP